MRQAVGVRGDLVTGLSAAAASELRELRVDVGERDGVWLEKSRVAQPR